MLQIASSTFKKPSTFSLRLTLTFFFVLAVGIFAGAVESLCMVLGGAYTNRKFQSVSMGRRDDPEMLLVSKYLLRSLLHDDRKFPTYLPVHAALCIKI